MDIDVTAFLKEDTGSGDVTTDAIISPDHHSKARIVAKGDGVIAGQTVAAAVFKALDADVEFLVLKRDGESVKKGDVVAMITGKTRAILTGERVALNFLQRLSGIATTTARFVKAVEGTTTKILDTRKTTPGLRDLEKFAVRMGGGFNHRTNLAEMALIKENHIEAAGSITQAVERVRKMAPVPVEVEVKNMEELEEALGLDLDRIMLDNWDIESTRKAVAYVGGRVPLEASGNMTVERIGEVALTGVDFISVGALTHSFSALDLSLLIEETGL